MNPLRRLHLALVVALCLFSAATAGAALGDVLHTIPCPGDNPADLAWVGSELYSVIFSPTEQRGIYRLDPLTGSVLGMVPYAGTMPQGLAYDGRNLWQVCLSGDCYYKMHPLTGEVFASFPAPGGVDGQPIGLGWDGASLWLADSRSPEKIWQLDTLGVTLGQIPAPGSSPYGLAWAAGFLWVSNNNTTGIAHIYKLDPATGDILASFPCPGGGGSPNGIAHDGDHLWIAVNTTDTIYQVDDGIAGAAVGEPPLADWDRPLAMRAVFGGNEVCVHLDLLSAGPVWAELVDATGRIWSRGGQDAPQGRHELRLAAATIPSGRYWLRVRSAEARATGGIWIVR